MAWWKHNIKSQTILNTSIQLLLTCLYKHVPSAIAWLMKQYCIADNLCLNRAIFDWIE